MTTSKTDRRFRNRYVLRNIILIVPPLVAFLLVWLDRGNFDFTFWLAIAFFIAWIVAWIFLDAGMLRGYHCPSCGQGIRTETIPERTFGDPIRFYCPKCDIEWDTGLRESDD
jgi:hypothetical protein